jgi:hypothetical protein
MKPAEPFLCSPAFEVDIGQVPWDSRSFGEPMSQGGAICGHEPVTSPRGGPAAQGSAS